MDNTHGDSHEIYQYILKHMKRRVVRHRIHRLLLTILVIGCIGLPLVAGTPVSHGSGITVQASWYGSIPSAFHEDPLPIRSHLSLGTTILPSIFGLSEKWEISGGLSGFYTTRSLLYGTTVWRPFGALGLSVELTYHPDPEFSITGSTSIFMAMYLQTKEMYPLVRVSLTPSYEILQEQGRNRLAVTIPIAVDLRTDYAAVSTGLGMKWYFDRTKREVEQ
jgi:hypothetical protein